MHIMEMFAYPPSRLACTWSERELYVTPVHIKRVGGVGAFCGKVRRDKTVLRGVSAIYSGAVRFIRRA
jgi:hypothetical protein